MSLESLLENALTSNSSNDINAFLESYQSLTPQAMLLNSESALKLSESTGFFMNYINVNKPLMTNKEIHTEINTIQKVIDSHVNTASSKELNSLLASCKRELKSRYKGEKIVESVYNESILESFNISENNMKIFESLKINPSNIGSTINRLDKLIESYEKNINNAGLLITKVLPVVENIAIKNADLLTENMVSIPALIASKINQENDCGNIVGYASLLKKSYNNMYFSECKESVIGKVLLENLYRFVNDLNTYNTEAMLNTDDINHDNVLYGKIFETYYTLGVEKELEDNDDITMEQVLQLGKYIQLLEASDKKRGAKSKVWKAAHAVEKKTRKMVNNQRDTYDTNKRNKSGLDKSAENIAKIVNYPLNQVIAYDKEERRKRLVEGRVRAKIWKVIKKAISGGILYLVAGPVVAVIGFMASIALDQKLDSVVRRQILHEMESELRIIKEKIGDARGEGKKKEKYALMRLQDKLQKDVDRVKFGLQGKY